MIELDLLSPNYVNVIKEAIALIRVAANSISPYGWKLMDVRREVRGRDGRTYTIDLILYKEGYVLEGSDRVVNALSLINFYGCLRPQCTEQDLYYHERIATLANRIIRELDALLTNLASLLREFGADFAIVGLVLLDRTTAPGDGGLQGLFNAIQLALISAGNPENVAIFFIWTDSTGKLWFVCIGQGCNQMTPQQRKREACRQAGLRPNCDISEWDIRRAGSGGEPPPPSGPIRFDPGIG